MNSGVSKTRSRVSRLRDRRGTRRRNLYTARPVLPEILLGLLLWLVTLAFLHIGEAPQDLPSPGQEARVTVVSAVDFSCIDVARTEWLRRQAAHSAPPVFAIRSGALNTATRTLDKLFDRLLLLRRTQEETSASSSPRDSLADALDLLGISVPPADFMTLAPPGREEVVLAILKQALSEVWAGGIISSDDRQSGFHGLIDNERIVLMKADKSFSSEIRIAELPLPSEALEAVVERALESIPQADRATLHRLYDTWIEPNLVYDPARTEQQRDQLRRAVEPVTIHITEGTTLVEAGEIITPSSHEKLRAHAKRLEATRSPTDHIFHMLGDAGLLLAGLIFCGGMLQLLQPTMLRRKTGLLLALTLTLLTLSAARGIVYLADHYAWLPPALTPQLLPLGLAPLTVAILAGWPLAVCIGGWITLALALFMGQSYHVALSGLLVTLVAIDTAQGAHRRTRVLRAGLWIALALILVAVAQGIVTQLPALTILAQCGAGLVNGILSASLALLLIPLFELAFGFTSDITLLELSDMGNPLLRRLAMEAPGTYHHSLMVANLAEAGARAIGANGLLVRVGAYYHDIGKLTKPEFFTENIQLHDNPHDTLTPNMSTLVITSHVKEGLTLGLRHKLPRVILDAIEQHHGNGLVSFFYHRAMQQQSDGQPDADRKTAVKDSNFRYPGPRPASREMAILALADSIEAASRSMDKPAASRVKNLVTEMINGKILDGQLDQADLTLSELGILKNTFTFTLTNMLHGRIPYPKNGTEHNQPTTAAPEPEASEKPGETVDRHDTT